MPLLEMKDLHTFFRTKRGIVKAVNGVSYSVDAGKTLGVVGESGSGKSVSAMSMLQLLDGNNALKQEKRDVTTGDWQFNFVPAGEIKFRVIEDKNGNGKWDTGNVVERRQPERAEIYANDEGEDTFATKANWEVEFSIDMNTLFAPVTMESLSRTLEEREAQRLRREAEKRAKEPKKKGHSHDNNQNNNRMNNSMNSTGGMFNNFR